MKTRKVNVHKIEIPNVRITSDWDSELLQEFASSIATLGIQEPIILGEDDEKLWLIDGLHRVEQAKLQGLVNVDAIVLPLTQREIQMRNLVMNRLRGKTKASEEAAVVTDLMKNHNVSIEEIAEKTGLSFERIEKMISIGSAHHEIWQALDEDRIKICHAYEISRLVETAAQLKMLSMCMQYRITCAALREAVDESLKLISERKNTPQEIITPQEIKEREAQCHFCKVMHPVRELSSPIMCMSCYGYLLTAIRQATDAADAATETTKAGTGEGIVDDTPAEEPT